MFQVEQKPGKSSDNSKDAGTKISSGINPAEMLREQKKAMQRNSGLSQDSAKPMQMQEDEEEIQAKESPAQMQEEEEEVQAKRDTAQMMVEEEEDKKVQAKTDPTQMQEEEEEIQPKMSTAQFQEEEEIQPKKGQQNSDSPASKSVNSFAHLNMALQAKMQNSFGTSFQNVNIHQNDSSASQMGALAYTQGDNVHFAPGQFNPNTQGGQELLGHELTHVVQQRQGRVQPTKQGKGMAVNDNPSLESEADSMGKKAANGQQTDVAGKGSGVQQKGEDDLPDVIRGGKIFGLDIIGYGYGEYEKSGLLGTNYYYKLVLAGEPENWKKVLNNCMDPDFKRYVLPFIIESGAYDYPGIESPYPRNIDSLKYWKVSKSRNVGSKDIVNLLKALYDTDKTTDSDIDFENRVIEATSNVAPAYKIAFDGLSEFIKMHQALIIQDVSADRDVRKMNFKDIKNLAEQSTKFYEPQMGKGRVVKAMMQNAVATAINSVKRIIDFQGKNKDEADLNKAICVDMIGNSALIIDGALAGYNGLVESMNSGGDAVFEAVWQTIPFNGKLVNFTAGKIKGVLKKGFLKILNGSGKDVRSYKEDMHYQFESALEEFRQEGLIDADAYSDFSIVFREYLSI